MPVLVSTSRSLRKWFGCFLLGDTFGLAVSEGDGIGVCNRDVLSGVFDENDRKSGGTSELSGGGIQPSQLSCP